MEHVYSVVVIVVSAVILFTCISLYKADRRILKQTKKLQKRLEFKNLKNRQ